MENFFNNIYLYNKIAKIIVISILIIISIIDSKKLYIPNSLSILIIFLGIFYNFYFKDNLFNSILGMALYSLPFSLIYGFISDLLNKEVMGYGDIKLTMGIGSFLAFTNLENIYSFFMYTYLSASIYAIYILIKTRKKYIEFPFAPFISISGCIMIYLN